MNLQVGLEYWSLVKLGVGVLGSGLAAEASVWGGSVQQMKINVQP